MGRSLLENSWHPIVVDLVKWHPIVVTHGGSLRAGSSLVLVLLELLPCARNH